MPTVTLNKKVFEKLVGKKLPKDKLADRISMLGTDLESIQGNEITVEVFPNRPDMLSEQGFARAFSSFIGAKTGLRQYKVRKSGEKVIIDKSVSKVRPYTACAIVKGLKLDEEKLREIIQVQEKLHITYGRNRKRCAIGVYPLEKITLPIRYLARKPKDIRFTPLDMPKQMSANQILAQHQTGKDYGHLLEGKDNYPLFIDAKDNVLSMPPIINSETVGKVTKTTKELFIECSGHDFDVVSICLNIIVTALADMGGDIYSMELDYSGKKKTTPNLNPVTVPVNLNYINNVLGLNLKEKDIKKLLTRMGYDYSNKKALAPAYRADILHPIDLVEDIAIAYGYEHFQEEIPNVSTIAKESHEHIIITKIAQLLSGLGLLETNTYHLMNEKELNTNMNLTYPPVALANAPTEHNRLRNWMIPSLMKVLNDNKRHEYPQNIFEIGTVFLPDKKTEQGVKEIKRLAALTCHKDANYTEAKQILEYVLDNLGLAYEFKETEHSSFIPGRVARVSVAGKEVAYVGELHPKVLNNWDLTVPVAALELNITELLEKL